MARPKTIRTKRTDEVVETVLATVSTGTPLAQVLRDLGIGITTWYDWTYADPVLAERFTRAREAGEEVIAADVLKIIDEPPPSTAMGSTDSGHVQWSKNRAELRLKLLAKWNPKKWGEKVQQEVSGPGGGPIQVVSGIDRGEGE